MEPEIKRVNFFDGQFLKQEEFRDEQLYHRHMRQRLNYILFSGSGVLPASPGDLDFIDLNVPAKTFRIGAGMAVSRKDSTVEGLEIIRRDDSENFDLAVRGFGAGDVVWVTVHYQEDPLPIPPSLPGDLTPTRLNENAIVTLHASDPSGSNPANGEEYIILGAIDFNTMTVNDTQRMVTRIRPSLIGLSPAIGISPPSVTAGGPVTLTVTSSGGFDLSGVTAGDVTITPPAGISGSLGVSGNTSASFDLTFTLATSATSGTRTLSVTSGVTVSATFSVVAGLSLSHFDPVDEPAGVTSLDLIGTGFSPPVTVEFTSSGGGLTAPVPVPTANITPTRISIPMGDIPTDATVGPVQVVTSAGTIPTGDSPTVTPPPVMGALSDATRAVNNPLTISGGGRYFAGTVVAFPNNGIRGPGSPTPFPSGLFGESLSETMIVVAVPPDPAGGGSVVTGRVHVTTAGGTVQSATDLTINP